MKTKRKAVVRVKHRNRPHRHKAPVEAPQPMVIYRQNRPVQLRRDQIDLIRRIYAKDLTEDEFFSYMQIAKSSRLDPFKKEIYALIFNKNKPDKRQMVILTGIDGYRSVAARDHNDFVGASNPRFEFGDRTTPSGKRIPESCTLEILSKSGPAMIVTRRWDEVAPHDLTEERAKFWCNSPCDQLEKCTEAKGLRKRYPGLGNLFVDSELDRTRMEETPGGRQFTKGGKRPDGVWADPSRQVSEEAEARLKKEGRWCEKHNGPMMKCPAEEHTKEENDAAFAAYRERHQSKPATQPPAKRADKVIDVEPEPKKKPRKYDGELLTGTVHNVTHGSGKGVKFITVQINRQYFNCYRISLFAFLTHNSITKVIECIIKNNQIVGLVRLGDDKFDEDGKTRLME